MFSRGELQHIQVLHCCSSFHSGVHFPSQWYWSPKHAFPCPEGLAPWAQGQALQLVTLRTSLQAPWWGGCSQGCSPPWGLLSMWGSSALSWLQLQCLLHPCLYLTTDLLVCTQCCLLSPGLMCPSPSLTDGVTTLGSDLSALWEQQLLALSWEVARMFAWKGFFGGSGKLFFLLSLLEILCIYALITSWGNC